MTSLRPQSLVAKITDRLSHEILSGAYQSLGLLPTEQKLILKYRVSRTVVREATKQLVSRGLAEIHHGLGVKIVNCLHRPLTQSLGFRLPNIKDRLEKLMEVRLLVEPAAARLAAKRATPHHLKVLREIQGRLVAASNASEAAEFDLQFHRVLSQAAGNEVIELMLESVADLGCKSREVTISKVGPERAFEHHKQILVAIEERDAQAAERAMEKHLEVAALDLQQYFKTTAGSRRK